MQIIIERLHLLQQAVAESGHQLCRRGACHRLVAEALESLLQGFVEEGGVAEAADHVLEVLVVQLDHGADILLLVSARLLVLGCICAEYEN